MTQPLQLPHPASAELDDPALRDACILVVDDEPSNVSVLQRVLRSAGVTAVHGLADPREAVARCLELDVDVVLLDLHMPHLDGVEVLTALAAAVPVDHYLPVLVLTADSTPEARDRALDAGAHDFLTKPFDRTEVILRVRNLLRTRALHLDVQRRNAALTAELDERLRAERRLEAQRAETVARVEQVLDGDGLRIRFQPVADLAAGRVVGVEALARFSHPPPRPPDVWFDEAAAVGRGLDLELRAVARALAEVDRLPADAFMSLNASPATAASPALAALLDAVAPDRLVIEITEHARIDDAGPLLAALAPLRARGVRLAVDDAGSGYAGLHQILRLRPDILKLDMALTRGIDRDPARRALTTAMIAFAEEIGAVLIAEGIETPEELAALRSLGVPWGQGFHLARPTTLPLSGG
jgi:EAL domain-containing protein (putative c-di-GMP-specific phosphodiesterase class I)